MQKEYDLTKTTIHTAIHDFLSSNGAKISSYIVDDIIVVSIMNDKFNVVIKQINNYDILFLVPKYDSSKSLLTQESVLKSTIAVGKSSMDVMFAGIVYDNKRGVLECNMLDTTMMFTTIDTSNVVRKTQSMFVGELNNKYLNPTECVYYGGNGTALISDSGEVIDTLNVQELQVALYMDMDNLPTAEENYDHWSTNIEYKTELFSRNRLVISLTNERLNRSLPTYFVLNSPAINLPTKDKNTCNGITLCLPIIFFVQREPRALDTYSAVGSTDILTFVDMFNIHSGRIIQTTYPVKKNFFQCFSLYKRRNELNLVGYAGIAFRQSEQKQEES